MRESIADILDREHRARMDRNRLLVDDWCDDDVLGGVRSPITPSAPNTLMAATGNFALTGRDAALIYAPVGSFILAAGAGVFTLTGDTMTPLVDYRLPADAGAFSLTGQAAGLIAARKLPAAAGSFALTGQDATLTKAGGGPPVLTSLGQARTIGGAQVQTSAALSSSAAATRLVIVTWTNVSGALVTSGTITPNVGTAQNITIVENRADPVNGGALGIGYAILASDADTATTLTPSITYATNPFTGSVITLWTAPSAGFASTTPTGNNHTTAASATGQSTTVATSAGGFIIAASYSLNLTSNLCTISGTETFSATSNDATAGGQHASANSSGTIATNASSTVTTAFAGTAGFTTLVTAAWR